MKLRGLRSMSWSWYFPCTSAQLKNKTWCQSKRLQHERRWRSTAHMSWDANNLPEAWRKFKDLVSWNWYFRDCSRKRARRKNAVIVSFELEKRLEIFITHLYNWRWRESLKILYNKYEAYVKPKTNVIFARYKFLKKIWGANEPFEQFVTDLRLLVKHCANANSDELVRDCIDFGIHSTTVREKLLSIGSELTLDKAVDIAQLHKVAKAWLKTITGSINNQWEGAVQLGNSHQRIHLGKIISSKWKKHAMMSVARPRTVMDFVTIRLKYDV